MLVPDNMTCNTSLTDYRSHDMEKNMIFELLQQFEEDCPNHLVYDLSCNSRKRKRVENRDMSLPCVTTSSCFW